MTNIEIIKKAAFTIVGDRQLLAEGQGIHEDYYSPLKTAFFKEKIADGSLTELASLAESSYGFAGLSQEGSQTFYYVGVQTTKRPSGKVVLHFPAGDYAQLTTEGGLSRLAFDELETQVFVYHALEETGYRYNHGPIAEVLLNGQPLDAEVAIWVPVEKAD